MQGKMPAILIFTCLLHLPAFAQTTIDTVAQKKKEPNDSSYIKHYDNYLNFTAGWNTRNTKYTISYPQYNAKLELSPKETHQFYVSLDYSFLYLYYSFTPRVFNINSADTIKGDSKRSTFGAGFSFKRWSFNFDYQKIKGYYLQNTNEFIPGWSKGDAYIQYPGLKTIQTGAQAGYNFNQKFSIASLTSGKEQQLKQAFTFFPILAYWHIKMKNEVNDTLEVNNSYTVNNDINLLMPVSANIVFAKNFYISVFAGPIIGIDFFKANGYEQNEKISTSGTKMSTGYYFRSSIGYTGKRFFTGIDIFARNYGHQQEDERFIKNSYGLQAYIGTRFDPPGFLKRSLDWLQKNRPL